MRTTPQTARTGTGCNDAGSTRLASSTATQALLPGSRFAGSFAMARSGKRHEHRPEQRIGQRASLKTEACFAVPARASPATGKCRRRCSV